MNDEFDSSAYECACDYAWHMMTHDHMAQTDALIAAAKHYGIQYQSLQRYWDAP